MLRADPGYLRQQTHKRDKGVCAICGTDTDAIKQHYNRLVAFAQRGLLAFERTAKKAMRSAGGIDYGRLQRVIDGSTVEEMEDAIARETAYRLQRWERYAESERSQGREPAARMHPDNDTGLERITRQYRAQAITMTPAEIRIRQAHRRMQRLAKARRARIAAELQAAGWHGVKTHKAQNMWQADHINPVQFGGGGCGLDNIQTACTLCHKRKTAEQARRAALIRRGIDPDAPQPPQHEQLALSL
jgi:5-methylcytosine-specific restriction endonuclease McrA